MVKKFENTFIRLIVLTECTSVTDTRTDGQTPHDGKGRAWCWHRAATRQLKPASSHVMPPPLHLSNICCKYFPYQHCHGKQKGAMNDRTSEW